MEKENEIKCDRTEFITCPYCGYESDECDYEDIVDKPIDIECEKCAKTFRVYMEPEYYYYSEKITTAEKALNILASNIT